MEDTTEVKRKDEFILLPSRYKVRGRFIVYKFSGMGYVYIGKHNQKTEYEDDGYPGSSGYFNEKIIKYGRSSFTKQILRSFPTEQEAYDFEKLLVKPQCRWSEVMLNMKEGGNDQNRNFHRPLTYETRIKGKITISRNARIKFLDLNPIYSEVHFLYDKNFNLIKEGNLEDLELLIYNKETKNKNFKILRDANRGRVSNSNSKLVHSYIFHNSVDHVCIIRDKILAKNKFQEDKKIKEEDKKLRTEKSLAYKSRTDEDKLKLQLDRIEGIKRTNTEKYGNPLGAAHLPESRLTAKLNQERNTDNKYKSQFPELNDIYELYSPTGALEIKSDLYSISLLLNGGRNNLARQVNDALNKLTKVNVIKSMKGNNKKWNGFIINKSTTNE